MATADQTDREPLALPAAGFADLDAVRAFCRTTSSAAYCMIPVR